jgi:hypothetical protein
MDEEGRPYYLFCSYFYSFPSANMRLICSHLTPGPIPEDAYQPRAKAR